MFFCCRGSVELPVEGKGQVSGDYLATPNLVCGTPHA